MGFSCEIRKVWGLCLTGLAIIAAAASLLALHRAKFEQHQRPAQRNRYRQPGNERGFQGSGLAKRSVDPAACRISAST